MSTPSHLHPVAAGQLTASVDAGILVALLPVVLAAALAAVHLFAYRLLFLHVVPRSRWLSLSGGSAVAYVFVHLLPELQRAGAHIEDSGSVLLQFERHVYIVALLGFTAFYGLEQFVRRSNAGDRDADIDDATGANADTDDATGANADTDDAAPDGDADVVAAAASAADREWGAGVFWLHIASFALYNALIGYLLLHREETGVASLLAFAFAMALHFLVNDYGLRDHHGRSYDRYARWVLAAAVFVGLGVGYVAPISELHQAVLFAFLAGSVVLNVIKEELPSERRSRFASFAAGVVGYSALLLAV